jgi:hypothetical protein
MKLLYKLLRKYYRRSSIAVALLGVAYLLLLYFPQPLFAYSAKHGAFEVYSRENVSADIDKVLDEAETKLQRSPIYDANVKRKLYLTGGFKMYALLSHKAYRSFANSVPFINNIFINKADIQSDRVFINRGFRDSRSLSGVIAHETAHLFIRNRYGTLRAWLMPTWKNEGYCEYIAGDSTMSMEEGLALWRQDPLDDTGYRYIKYHAMVKFLLEHEKISVDDLFDREFDEKEIADRTFASIDGLE